MADLILSQLELEANNTSVQLDEENPTQKIKFEEVRDEEEDTVVLDRFESFVNQTVNELEEKNVKYPGKLTFSLKF